RRRETRTPARHRHSRQRSHSGPAGPSRSRFAGSCRGTHRVEDLPSPRLEVDALLGVEVKDLQHGLVNDPLRSGASWQEEHIAGAYFSRWEIVRSNGDLPDDEVIELVGVGAADRARAAAFNADHALAVARTPENGTFQDR